MENKTYRIYIVAYKGISFLSRLIRWKTSSEYSHVEILSSFDDDSISKTYGAINFQGVQAWNIEKHTKGTKYDIYQIYVTKKQYTKFWNFITNQIGKRYDIKGILGYIDNRIKQDDIKWYCSELIYEAFLEAEIMLFNKLLKYPSPDLIVLSKQMKLIRSGIVGKDKDLFEPLTMN